MTFTAKTNPRVIGDQAIRTIALKGQPILKEGRGVSSKILPGQLVQLGAASGVNGLQIQSTAGINCRRAVAMEMDLLGKTVRDAYVTSMDADGNTVYPHIRYGSFHAGQEVAGRFSSPGAATTVKIGVALQADNSGNFIVQTGTATIIAYTLEEVVTTAGAFFKLITMEIA